MINQVIYEAVALVVFTIGGAFSGLALLSIISKGIRGIKRYILDFSIGLFGCLVFMLISEIYYQAQVTYYTIFSFVVGYVGVLLFFGEKPTFALSGKVWSKLKSVLSKKRKQKSFVVKKKRATRVPKVGKKNTGVR